MTERPTIVIVGAGKRGRRHVENLQSIRGLAYLSKAEGAHHSEDAYASHAASPPEWVSDVGALSPRITAVVDPDADERAETVRLLGRGGDDPATFESLDACLAETSVDAAVVASPNHTHVEIVESLFDAGVDVLCEKPLGTTLDQHERLIAATDAFDGTFYPAFNLRMSPFYRRIRRLLREGAVGDLGMVSCREVRQPLVDGFRYRSESSGGPLLEKNVHDFDLFNWYTRARPRRVHATGGQHVLQTDTDIEDQAVVTVEYDDGTLATLELCLYAPWDQRSRTYELRGSEGLLRSPEEALTLDRYHYGGTDRVHVNTEGSHAGGDFVQTWRFLRCLTGDAEPPGTPREAKAAAAVAIAAQRSIATGHPYRIDDRYRLSQQS